MVLFTGLGFTLAATLPMFRHNLETAGPQAGVGLTLIGAATVWGALTNRYEYRCEQRAAGAPTRQTRKAVEQVKATGLNIRASDADESWVHRDWRGSDWNPVRARLAGDITTLIEYMVDQGGGQESFFDFCGGINERVLSCVRGSGALRASDAKTNLSVTVTRAEDGWVTVRVGEPEPVPDNGLRWAK